MKKEPRLEAKLEAYLFQAETVKAIRDNEYAGIFLEQGLGKSKVAIDLMLYWLENKLVDVVLFIAKKGLINNWLKEFSSHTYMKPKLITQDRKANYYSFNSPTRLILTHYEAIRSEQKRFELFLKARNVAAILDESAKIKNPNSSLTKVLLNMAPLFKKRFIMTGTPVANRPYDLWAQINFLDQGKSLGLNFHEFKSKTDLTNDLYDDDGDQMILEDNLSKIYSVISSFTVRQTKKSGVIELPEKSIQNIYTDWERNQYDLYRGFKKEMRAVIIRNGIPEEDCAEEILKRLLRLVQVASNPKLIDESYSSDPGKLETLNSLLEEIISLKEKAIIWSSFTDNVDWLTDRYSVYNAQKVHGKMDMDRRNKAIERFINEDDAKLLIATPGAAKEGLTLTVANHVIFYDRSFSLDDYLQAQDRIHRISQIRRCYIYNLIMKESIDEWVDVLIQAKYLAAQLAQGDISLEFYRSQISYEFGSIIKSILDIH